MSHRKSLFMIGVFILFSVCLVYAQNPEWINYTNGDNVTYLAEEGNFIWAGTTGGLVKIDKVSGSTTFFNKANSGLPANSVSAIAIDGSGNKWIGTQDGGLTVFKEGGVVGIEVPLGINTNPKSQLPTQITLSQNYPNPFNPSTTIKIERIMVENGLPNGNVSDVLHDRLGYIWFATDDGLSKYDGYTFINYRYDPADSTSIGSGWITDLYEDCSGIVWIASNAGGLNKFDREKEMFIRYTRDPNNPASISINCVKCIAGSRCNGKEVLWIGTGNGLNKFDPQTGQFTYYPHTDRGYPYAFVEALAVDSCGNVWVGSSNGGLHNFNPKTEQFTHYRNDPANPRSLSWDLILSLLIDRKGNLWIGTHGGGLNKFDHKREQFSSYRYNPANPDALSNDSIFSLFEDKKGMFWVGTAAGFNVFNRDTEKFTHYQHDPDDPNSLSNNIVLSINGDKSDIVWVGTWGGLNKIDPQKNQFSQIRHIPGNKNSLSNNDVTCIFESYYGGEDVLWIGTRNGGLNKLNRSTGEFTCYRYNPDNPNSLNNDFVFTIYEARSGILWIGNLYSGLIKFDRRSEQFTRYLYSPEKPNSISCQSVRSIFEDKSGLLWIGTQTGGINTFDPVTEKFALVSRKMEINQIYRDHMDTLWFATGGGIKKLNRDTGEFTSYRHDPADPSSLSHDWVMSIYENKAGNFWIGTYGGGLDLFERHSGKFIHYTVKDGLPNNIIMGILEDEQDNLWLATYKGISKFNPRTGKFRNYDQQDGLAGDQYNDGAYFKNKNGEMFVGGVNGLNAFYPENIRDNKQIPAVLITDFQIFNQPVPIRKNGSGEEKNAYSIPAHISTLNNIELPYNKSVFSLEFAALDYHSPDKNRYAYKMEGVDPDWVYTDASRRFATYTNLDPGEYLFQVKGSNNSGVWNEKGTSLKIIITPPWWHTNWAYILYVFLIGTAVYNTWRFQSNKLKMKHQLEIEHLHTEKLEEIDRIKSRFFTNISHEFRTPLTLIKGPVKQIMSGEFKGNLLEPCRMILRNSDRLLSLINQLLDLSKIESGRMMLKVTKTDLNRLFKELLLSFSALAERKKITLKFEMMEPKILGYIDCDKVEKIVTNLLSNAFKFTPVDGEIVVTARLKHPPWSPLSRGETGGCKEKNYQSPITYSQFQIPNSYFAEVTVTNTGPLIPPEQLDKIFDRFYQADTTYKKDGEGSGIGLALTKELVELHHGIIGVECRGADKQPPKSPFSKGDLFHTTFRVVLPIGKNYYKGDEIIEALSLEEHETNLPPIKGGKRGVSIPEFQTGCSTSSAGTQDDGSSTKTSPLILIVEDNPDVTSYICSFLEKDYRIITAIDGKEGWQKTLQKYPDLIISDIMMPEMDGFELCQKVKSDQRISHIPVILLTAKADMDSKIKGLEFGADDYVCKPFEADELKVRSRNLIEQRKKLREKFARIIEIYPAEIAATSMDEQFLKHFIAVFESHVSESDFSTGKLATEVGMSRSNLNRKLRALTNQSTHEFVRNLRLKRAAQLLKKSVGSVAEIAYQVGFNNTSHFAKAFRAQFGQSPSEFAHKNQ